MAVEKTKDLWVFIETEDEGTAKSVGLELLVPGRRLADKQNGKLVAVILGSNVAPALEAVLNSHPSFPFCKRVSHFESDLQILYPTFHFCNDFPVFSLTFMI